MAINLINYNLCAIIETVNIKNTYKITRNINNE